MSATQSESNPGFSGMAPSAGACLSTQEVWQRIGDMAGQVSSLATLHDTLSATLLSTVMGPAPRAADMTTVLQAKIENDDEVEQRQHIISLVSVSYLVWLSVSAVSLLARYRKMVNLCCRARQKKKPRYFYFSVR